MIWDNDGQKIYWSSNITHQILTANLVDTVGTVIVTDALVAIDLDIDHLHHKLYWADNPRGKIYYSNLDGSNKDSVANIILPNLTPIALYGTQDRIFFADLDSASIWSSSLNGENKNY